MWRGVTIGSSHVGGGSGEQTPVGNVSPGQYRGQLAGKIDGSNGNKINRLYINWQDTVYGGGFAFSAVSYFSCEYVHLIVLCFLSFPNAA